MTEHDATIWYQPFTLDDLNRRHHDTMIAHLGIRFTALDGQSLSAAMAVDHRTVQPFRRLHGGASVALAETVASAAGHLVLDPTRFAAVGLEINANHLRPVGEGVVVATATPDAIGRTSQVWTVRIRDERDKLVCISRVTLAVIPLAKAAPEVTAD